MKRAANARASCRIGASYTTRPALRKDGASRTRTVLAMSVAIEIAPGVRHYPGYSRPRRPGGAARRNPRGPCRRAAVRSAHAEDRQAVLGPDEQLRPARLGVGRTGGYRYQPTHPETGAPWPPMPARLLAALGGARARRAAAGSLPDQPLRRGRADGPASGPRRSGAVGARRLAVARRYGVVPGRRR